jgi:HPt (histidine-containing phosphotransfer) domain-containing protein
MDDFLSKPINSREFLEVLNRHFSTSDTKPASSAQPVEADADLFDRASLMERVDGDLDFMNEILEVYLEDVQAGVRKLKGAMEARDADSLATQAHTLKGASANVGAGRLRDVAFEIETAGKERDLEKVGALVSKLADELKRFKDVLATVDGQG